MRAGFLYEMNWLQTFKSVLGCSKQSCIIPKRCASERKRGIIFRDIESRADITAKRLEQSLAFSGNTASENDCLRAECIDDIEHTFSERGNIIIQNLLRRGVPSFAARNAVRPSASSMVGAKRHILLVRLTVISSRVKRIRAVAEA